MAIKENSNRKRKQDIRDLVLTCFITILILSLVVVSIQQTPQQTDESKANIQSIFGCLETSSTQSEFEAKQYLRGKLLGYQLAEC